MDSEFLEIPNMEDIVTAPEPDPEPPRLTQSHSDVHARLSAPLEKYTLYETKTRLYIVASNAREVQFKVMEIDMTGPKQDLTIIVDPAVYSRAEVMDVLSHMEEEGGGNLTKRLTAWGLLGFIRFTDGYYMVVVTKRSVVALLGGHYVYHIDKTEMIPLARGGDEGKTKSKSADEARYMSIFQSLDLSKTFYFSYAYDITNTLQRNMEREKRDDDDDGDDEEIHSFNHMFIWNHHLLHPVEELMDNVFEWFLPIIHGFIDQAKINVCGARSVYVTLIARRSHYFAGARFLKRGVNDRGNVANEVETEQIVADLVTSSFHDKREGIFNSPRYTSYVQHRGSIPLYWSQDVSNMTPKPPIEINLVDPFFASAALHFDDLFKRYDAPILVLNLIKSKERTPREGKLLREFSQCIEYLNQFLIQRGKKDKLQYTHWDMSRASKSRNLEVIEFLERYSTTVLEKTGFFHNSKGIQKGICRSNCIDCLDRTNAAQFVIAKKALGYQLRALGIVSDVNLSYDCDAVNLLTEMYHDHGDTIALQYGGSHLVNTMETYRKINQWRSHSRDMLESIRRFYSNSFVDSQRQEAINLFLGNHVVEDNKPRLWDLPSDHFLHNNYYFDNYYLRRSYIFWWTEINLLVKKYEKFVRRKKELQVMPVSEITEPLNFPGSEQKEPVLEVLEDKLDALVSYIPPYPGFFDNYWNECYKPRSLSSFHKVFAYNMNSTSRYNSDDNPFRPRKEIKGLEDITEDKKISEVPEEVTKESEDPRECEMEDLVSSLSAPILDDSVYRTYLSSDSTSHAIHPTDQRQFEFYIANELQPDVNEPLYQHIQDSTVLPRVDSEDKSWYGMTGLKGSESLYESHYA